MSSAAIKFVAAPDDEFFDWSLAFSVAVPGQPASEVMVGNGHSVPQEKWDALATPGSGVTVKLLEHNRGHAQIARTAAPEGGEYYTIATHAFGDRGHVGTTTRVPATPALDAQLRAAVAEGFAYNAQDRGAE